MPRHKPIVGSDSRPTPKFSWESVVECANWDLARAIEAGDIEQAAALRRSIRVAEHNIRIGYHPWSSIHLHSLFTHDMPQGLPDVRIEIPPVAEPTSADLDLAERLMNAHDRAVRDEAGVTNRPYQDVWEMVRNEFHGEFVDALRLRNTRKVAAMLCAAFRHNISYGLGTGVAVYEAIQTPEGNSANAALTIDRLASLAEALAALPYENPEQGRWGQNVYQAPETLVGLVETAAGISLCPPTICGYFGIPIRSGYLFAQSCNQFYLAIRIRQLLSHRSWPRRVCEIGAGYGGGVYYAYRLGFIDYRVFDLPVINVLQAYYLIRALPEANVVLYGEPESHGALCIYPYWMLKEQSPKSFGLAVNQDSLPEIAPGVVADYLNEIVRTAHCFLSINQEGEGASCRPDILQNVVPRMVDRVPRLKRVGRFPFWMRAGYVEEIYQAD